MEGKSRLSRLLLGDGRETPLPETRRAAFGFYAKMNFIKLMIMGVICGLFFIPALVWLYSANYSRSVALGALDPTAADYADRYAQVVLQHAFSDNLVMIPLFALFFLGLSGMFNAAKRMAFYEGCSFLDFFRGIRQNGLGSAGAGALFGLSYFVMSFNTSYYGVSTLPPITKGIMSGISMLQFGLVTIVVIYLMAGLAVYTNTFFGHIKNAVKLTFGVIIKNVLALGLILLPLIAVLLIPSPFQLPLVTLLPIFYIGFATLAVMCYANYIFDLHINPSLGEEYVGKGLRKD